MDRFALAFALVLPSSALAAPPADCSKGAVPSGPVKGQLGGDAFAVDNVRMQPMGMSHIGINGVTFDGYTLFFEQTAASGDTRYIEIDTVVPQGALPDGKTFHLVPGQIEIQPQAAPGAPEVQGWSISDDARDIGANSVSDKKGSLQIAFARRKGDSLSGKVYFCTPSLKGTWMGGDFSFAIER